MPTDRIQSRAADAPEMSAELIAGRRFGQSWRGYDPEEVTKFLAQVADQVRSLKDRCDRADAARREAEHRALHPELDEATLMAAVGEETAAILRSARSAAAEITSKAEAAARAACADAESKAAEILAEAESLLAARTAEAEAAAADIREAALAEAEQLREEATARASAQLKEAEDQGAQAVQAAQALREKILTDLARRRKVASVQVEQLRAGRERLLDAYLVVRRTLDEVTDELQRADAEARAAADAVGRQHGPEAQELVDLRSDDAWLPASSNPQATPAVPVNDRVEASPAGAGDDLVGGDGPGGQAPVGSGGAEQAGGPAHPPAPEAGSRSTGDVPVVRAPKAGQVAKLPASAFLAHRDAVESVRILREETAPALPGTGTGDVPPGAPEGATEVSSPGGGGSPEGTAAEDYQGGAAPLDGNGSRGAHPDVQGLFARIRASREEAAAQARKALGESGPSGAGEGAAATPQPSSAPVPDAGTETEWELLEPGTRPVPVTGPGAGQAPAWTAESDDQGPDWPGAFFAAQAEVAGRIEASLARKLKRALQDEQNSLLDRLRGLKAAATPANLLPTAEEHADRFVDAGRQYLAEAARAGGETAVSVYGLPESTAGIDPQTIDDLAEELGRAIAEPLRQRLELALRTSSEEAADLADTLGAAYREWKTQRIEAAARDQVAAAFARGAYLSFPAGSIVRWASNGSPCPDCEDNALAGAQDLGEPWPTGQLHPPAHPGCTCALAPAEVPLPLPVAADDSSGALANANGLRPGTT